MYVSLFSLRMIPICKKLSQVHLTFLEANRGEKFIAGGLEGEQRGSFVAGSECCMLIAKSEQ